MLHEVVAGGGEETAFGDGSAPVAGAADALHGYGYGSGGADLADEVDVTYVYAEFEGGCRDEDFYFAVFEALFGVQAKDAREGAVVRGNVLGAEAAGEFEGDFFDEAAGVDEDESGAVILCVGGELVEYFGPHAGVGD